MFFAGGSSDAGISDDVEVWGVDPFHRRGEPEYSLSGNRRDVGGTGCGDMFVVAGGTDGKIIFNTVDVINGTALNGSDPNTLKPRTFFLDKPLLNPAVGCLDDRYVMIAGGDDKECTNQLYMFDTLTLPAEGQHLIASNISVPTSGELSVATTGPAVIFSDGKIGLKIHAC